MPPQVSAGSITDAHLLDQGGIVQTALLQIADRFRMAVELELIEGGRLLPQPGNGSGCEFLLEKRHRLVERQIEEQLDKANPVATAAAAMAVEQILRRSPGISSQSVGHVECSSSGREFRAGRG